MGLNRDSTGPTGTRAGRGGWLEHTQENLVQFRSFFRSHVPGNLSPDNLTTLSSTFSNRYPNYKLLPPKDLWQHMVPTLAVLRELTLISGVEFEIKSAYRSEEVNSISKGKRNSAHLDFSGLDVSPTGNRDKVEALVKHYYHERGQPIKMGLGFYSQRRFHIDAKTPNKEEKRRWEWNEGPKECAKHYNKYFSLSLHSYASIFHIASTVGSVVAAAASPLTTGAQMLCEKLDICQSDESDD